jgi:hypothetical protein
MTDPAHWSLDRDPPRDRVLARQLRAAEGAEPASDVDWDRLQSAIMAAAGGSRPGVRGAQREWWDVVVQWRRTAVAASVAAILGAGAMVWRSGPAAEELAIGEVTAPESVALARVVADYPDDAVLVSFLDNARADEFTSWGER